jgi:lactoylglutathione lyase
MRKRQRHIGVLKMIKSILHIGLVVQDLEKSVDFYSKILGFKLFKQKDHPSVGLKNAFLSLNSQILELIQYTDSRAGIVRGWGIIDHLSFEVENLDEAILKLRDAKVELIGSTRTLDGEKLIFFKGPSGERLEIIEPASAI